MVTDTIKTLTQSTGGFMSMPVSILCEQFSQMPCDPSTSHSPTTFPHHAHFLGYMKPPDFNRLFAVLSLRCRPKNKALSRVERDWALRSLYFQLAVSTTPSCPSVPDSLANAAQNIKAFVKLFLPTTTSNDNRFFEVFVCRHALRHVAGVCGVFQAT